MCACYKPVAINIIAFTQEPLTLNLIMNELIQIFIEHQKNRVGLIAKSDSFQTTLGPTKLVL